MGARTISAFQSQIGLGLRNNQFEVTISYPGGVVSNIPTQDQMLLIKAAQIPASTVPPIDVPFRGRQLKVMGDRTFAEWTVTIYNDVAFSHRNALEQWMNSMNSHQGNIGNTDFNALVGSAVVNQLNRDGGLVQVYEIAGIWPSEVGQIELSSDTVDTLEEYPVTFQIERWDRSGVTS